MNQVSSQNTKEPKKKKTGSSQTKTTKAKPMKPCEDPGTKVGGGGSS